MDVSRRSLMHIGAVGWTGLTLPVALAAAEHSKQRAARARSCILLYMDGGPSHIDLFDLKPQAPREIRGPYQSIHTTVEGLRIGELCPQLARQMHRMTLIRSVCHEQTVHDPAVYQMLTGYRHVSSAGGLKVEADDVPHMASAFGRVDRSPAAMPKVVELPETMNMEGRILPGQNAGFLGSSFDPFRVRLSPAGEISRPDFQLSRDVSRDRLDQRERLLSELDRDRQPAHAVDGGLNRYGAYQLQALEILHNSQVADAFELGRESPETRQRYGNYRHGQSVLLARRLVEAGARFVTVYWGREDQDWADGRGSRPANNPWDTHRNHFPLTSNTLMPRADQTLSALLEDLHERGLLEETLVVWMGDFGRTPRISQPWASRDHWPHAFSILMAGGGVPSGLVLGSTDDQAAHVTDNPVSPADITATIFKLLGVNPHTSVPHLNGQPHQISNGRPIRELV